jgi:nicotinamidase-related amidase
MGTTKLPKDAWALGTKNTALVVIDMQRRFVDKGAPIECVGARELVPGINELTNRCRELGIPVIFVKANRRPDLSDWGLTADFAPTSTDPEMEPVDGRKGAEFCSGLDVRESDYIVHKIRYSALIPGSSTLEPLLRGLGKDSIIICGVATDVCVGATTIDAMMLGFKVFFVGDLTATMSEERRKLALEVYNRQFAKVVTFDEVMKELAHLPG